MASTFRCSRFAVSRGLPRRRSLKMPLREDLLTPIAGENPAGQDLYYDKVFDQIKEARREEEDDLPAGDWGRSQVKKADHRAVIKLAGEALATRTKDLRLAGWLIEAQLRIES